MVDITIIAFVFVAIVGIGAAVFVFLFRDILHSALALSIVFLANSLAFLLVDQPLLAVIQLFIMIGGITTFLFVGVASATYSNFKYTRALVFLIAWAVLFIAFASQLDNIQLVQTQSNVFTPGNAAFSLQSSYGMFYLILLLTFGVSIGAILLLKKIGSATK